MDDRFLLVRFEFTHSIGPDAGLYVVQSDERHLLAITVTHAPAAKRHRADEPRPVPLGVATFARGHRHSLDEAIGALADLARDPQPFVAEALEVVNRAVRAYRLGAQDPHVQDLHRLDARAVHVGYGTGRQVTAGEYEDAIEVPPPKPGRVSRTEQMLPSHHVAQALTHGAEHFEGEELVLRARLDARHGRLRAARAGLAAGIALLRDECGGDPAGWDALIDDCHASETPAGVEAIADAALRSIAGAVAPG